MKSIKKNKYNFGSFVKTNSAGIGSGGQLLSSGLDVLKTPGKANVGLSTGQGILSGAAAGAALGPWGMAGGALIGGTAALLGSAKQKKLIDHQQQDTLSQAFSTGYDNMNTNSVNPYGTQIYQDGSTVSKNSKKQPNINLANWDGMVQKDDGSVGMWGNPLNNPMNNSKVRLNPKGIVPKNQVDSLMNLYPNLGLNYINPAGQSPMLGANQSDMVKKMLGKKYEKGSDVEQNIINIEKGELQIDPNTGKILREYNNMNPETGGLYSPHSKGKDTKHNFVTADPGTFIITESKASKYKKAIENNDKLSQETILQNIRNYKSKVNKGTLEFANGGGVNDNPYLPNKYLGTSGYTPQIPLAQLHQASLSNTGFNIPTNIGNQMQNTVSNFSKQGTKDTMMINGINPLGSPNGLSQGLDFASKYGPSLLNTARGLFGNVENQSYGKKITNPYQNQVLDNMPQDINMQPLYNSVLGQQTVAVNDIRNNSNSSAVYRANRQNIGSNTQRNLANVRLQEQQLNNQARGQRSSIYNNLGQQSMQEQQRMQGFNFQVDQINSQNRGAKQQRLDLGIGQMQQVYQNDKYNNTLQGMDKFKASLIPQIFANTKYYKEIFGEEAVNKLSSLYKK